MKNIFKILLALLVAALLVSCSPKTNDANNVTDGPVDSDTQTPSNKDDDTIMYTNLTKDETKDELKKALSDKGLDDGDVNAFIKNLDEYNESANANELSSDFTKYNDEVAYYNSMDKFAEENPDFLGVNCRITTFTLMEHNLDIAKEIEDKSSVL
ncbi:MAG: DUF4300 family protein, partial [Fenollaria timonensis]